MLAEVDLQYRISIAVPRGKEGMVQVLEGVPDNEAFFGS